MKTLLVLGHMGIGDHLLTNGLIRSLAFDNEIHLISKKIYRKTLIDIFLDIKENVKIISVEDDISAIKYFTDYGSFYDSTLKFGNFGIDFMRDSKTFDESFYKQSQIDYKMRWKNFKIGYETLQRVEKENILFMHDVSSNGKNLSIDEKYINKSLNIVMPEPKTKFLDYIPYIRQAKEIHCIDSSFAILVEHCETNAKLYLHRYCRPNVLYPNYTKDWEIIC
jgi:hypothetical protein